jgi:uncharacterized protein (DUF433 family)
VLDLSTYIERRWFQDRPHIRGRRIPVSTIAYAARDNHLGIPELMYNFTLSEPEVLAALLYYAENKDAIDAQEALYASITPEEWERHGENAILLRRNDGAPGSERTGEDRT